jgi:hypothetical protein
MPDSLNPRSAPPRGVPRKVGHRERIAVAQRDVTGGVLVEQDVVEHAPAAADRRGAVVRLDPRAERVGVAVRVDLHHAAVFEAEP